MILSFINIRKVPRKVLKTSGFALGFQHLPRDLANVNEWKIMFDPYIVDIVCNGKTPVHFFVQLCRQNDQSDNFKIFSSFDSSIKVFDNILGDNFSLMNIMLLKFLIFCIQAGIVRNGWKFLVAKWT